MDEEQKSGESPSGTDDIPDLQSAKRTRFSDTDADKETGQGAESQR